MLSSERDVQVSAIGGTKAESGSGDGKIIIVSYPVFFKK